MWETFQQPQRHVHVALSELRAEDALRTLPVAKLAGITVGPSAESLPAQPPMPATLRTRSGRGPFVQPVVPVPTSANAPTGWKRQIRFSRE